MPHDHQGDPVDRKMIVAYSKTTHDKQIIPESWLDHPVLGRDFARTPSSLSKTSKPKPKSGTTPAPDQTPASGDQE